MEIRLELQDTSYRSIVRGLLLTGQGPRDFRGYEAILQDWNTGNSPHKAFDKYCYAQSWTLAEVLAFLEYQCCYLFADGLDEDEFSNEWPIFFQVLKNQKLLNVRAFIPYEQPDKRAQSQTVAGVLELEVEL